MSQTVDDGVGDMAVRRGPNTVLRLVERWSLAAAGVLVWQWVTAVADNPYFPTPLAIVREAGRLWFSGPPSRLGLTGEVVDDVLPGLAKVAAGWGVAAVVGVTVGVVLGRSSLGGRRWLAFARAAVPLAVPVFLVFVHVGPVLEVAAIAAGCVWPVLIGAFDGARDVDPAHLEVARAYMTPWYYTVIMVIVPSAAPEIFAGLRVSLLTTFPLMVAGELIEDRLVVVPATAGLPGVWAWLVLVSGLGWAAARLLSAVERWALRWHE